MPRRSSGSPEPPPETLVWQLGFGIVLLKILILTIVFLLIAHRIRRAFLVWRQLVAESIGRAHDSALGRTEPPPVDLVTCSQCGDAVPRLKANESSRGSICRDCLVRTES